MEIEKQVVQREKSSRLKRELISLAKLLPIIIIIVFGTRIFLFTNYIVYGESMMPTINDRDRIIVNKICYDIWEPKRFDMIVFQATESSEYIKRIIGLPGDKIEFKDDILFVNGEVIEEIFLNGVLDTRLQLPFTKDFTLETITGEINVPENHLFVLGDNRVNSIDSRRIGFVAYDQVVGKAQLTFWPLKEFRILK